MSSQERKDRADQQEPGRTGGGSTAPVPPFPPQELTPPGEEAKMRPSPRFAAPEYRGASKLEGRVALITGGDSGIGRAVATLFAREGADVAFTSLSSERKDAEATRAAVQAEKRRALALVGDVRDFDFCRGAVEATVSELGRLDILVNNAAYQRHRPSVEDVSLEQWDTTFRTNIYGYFYMVKAALPHLHEGAAIINTGSVTAVKGSAELIDYAATKGAIHAFTKSLAPMLMKRGIRVNCVSPGPVWTPLNPAERSDEDMEHFGAKTAAGRPAQPEEIAPAYVYFASAVDSSYAIGEILVLSGG